MASGERPYQRLPGTGYRQTIPSWAIVLLFFVIGIFALLFRGRRVQLWQGAEHLLLVETDGHREFYKRFYYGDIQSIAIYKTRDGLVMNVLLLVVCSVFAALAIAASDLGLRIFLASMALFFGLLAFANSLVGATCRCSIRTAVQTEELPSLTRLKRARKVFNRLRPLVAAAQGTLTSEEIPARMQQWLTLGIANPPSAGEQPTINPSSP
jgi:hypothetical protein